MHFSQDSSEKQYLVKEFNNQTIGNSVVEYWPSRSPSLEKRCHAQCLNVRNKTFKRGSKCALRLTNTATIPNPRRLSPAFHNPRQQ
ncbi:hypothetical protein TNCV_4118881 [Trichonephila clavipes]|nr:hypothetical protein TNCV_4118881 [Trichonephila clavipes]